MDRLSSSEFPHFSMSEVLELERIYNEMGEKSLDQNFCEKTALSFSSSLDHAGKASLTWEQVQQWFQNKLKESSHAVDGCSPKTMKLAVVPLESPIFENGNKNSSNPKGEQAPDISGLSFEARSTKDLAWHDVATFLNYRVLSTGELEARVRYAGFSKEQDEWVNVKSGLRERSIPLEPSECHKVNDGDLVLCFLERHDYALHCDAHVVKVLRRHHGPIECRCIFIVRYVHDKTEEGVSWNKLCRRPSEEQRVDNDEEHAKDQALSFDPLKNLWG